MAPCVSAAFLHTAIPIKRFTPLPQTNLGNDADDDDDVDVDDDGDDGGGEDGDDDDELSGKVAMSLQLAI